MKPIKLTKGDFKPSLWPAWFVVFIGFLLAKMPIKAIILVGTALGKFFYYTSGRRRHITEVNINLCFPELHAEEQTQLVKKCFMQIGIGLVELLVPWLNPSRDISRFMDVYGAENLKTALNENKGVIIVGAHFASLDFLIPALCAQGPVDCMYRANRNRVWEWLQVQGRKNFFGRVIEREEMKDTIRCLKDGRALWYGADQDYGAKHSIFAPFFNINAATITATSRLARINGSPVIFLRQFRNLETMRWELHFSEILRNFPSGKDHEDAIKINQLIETGIRVDPTQYLWMHRRFKTRPDNQKSFY